ncbi:MAG: hypothetical protein AB1567_02195 [bacterium]
MEADYGIEVEIEKEEAEEILEESKDFLNKIKEALKNLGGKDKL